MKQEENTILMLNVFKSDTNLPQLVIDNYNLAIKAVERQLEKEGIDKWGFGCPTCEEISEYQNNYCPNCGQKLIWGKE